MQTATRSVPDVQSSSISCVAPKIFRCPDPNCNCIDCLLACDSDARNGRIPTNFFWWMSQTHYPVGMAAGETGPR